MGQAKLLQVLYSLSIGQVTPPWRPVVRMERLRRLVPVAQVALHAVKAVQADTRQSIGHAKVLQVLIDLLIGQEAPPNAAGVTTERLRCLVPVAQVAEQAP